jgi:WD40 repeat protein/transcriptional regulator with XRE-family HTH domain
MSRGRRDKAVSPEEAENSQGARMRINRQKKGISLTELAKSLGYTKGYLSTVETGRILPPPTLIKQYEKALLLQPDELINAPETSEQQTRPTQGVSTDAAYIQQKQSRKATKEDWGEAPIVASFYGRAHELDVLKQWIIADKNQIVALLGLGGIGKSTLAVLAANNFLDDFEYIFWRSLQNAPAVDDILKGCLQFLSGREHSEVAGDFNGQVLLLIQILQEHRCLLVLDNLEAILERGEEGDDEYWERFTNYTILLRRIGEIKHNSCLLLTSREKPKEIALLEARAMPVRSLQLAGLETRDARKILAGKDISGSVEEYEKLADFYRGHPLALRLVAKFIQEFFDGSITSFIKENELVPGDVHDLLSQHFAQLSEIEQELLCWLAIEREAVSMSDLEEDFVQPPSRRSLIEALTSLQRRFLIEKTDGTRFALQPVIMEYITDWLVELVCAEINQGKINQLDRYALLKAQAVEYIRSIQERLILKPTSDLLLKALGKEGCKALLKSIVVDLHQSPQRTSGYAAGNLLNLLIHLKVDLRQTDFSHLTIRQAYLQGASLPRVNFAYASFSQSVFSDTFGSILALALSSNNHYLAAGTAHGAVRLWNATTGTVLHICEGHSNWVRTVAFSPNGTLLASGGDDKTIRLWDVGSGQCSRVLSEHADRVRMVVFSPDDSLLISSSDDQTIRFWDVESGECRKVLTGHEHRVRTIALSPDSRLLVSGSDDQTIRFWDVESGECRKVLTGHEHRVRTIALSPDGRLLVSGGDDQTIRFWDVESGECRKVLKGHNRLIRALAFNPAGDLLASGGEDWTIRLWDVESGACLRTLTEHANAVRSLVFYADGNRFISGSDDQTIRVWETRSGRGLKTLQGYSNWISSVAFSPDGSRLASGCHDNSIQLWRMDTGEASKILKDHHGLVYSVAFNADGTLLASGSQDHTVRLWDVGSGQCLKVLHGHTDQVNSVAFNREGNLLASGSEDNTVRLWNVRSYHCIGVLEGHKNRVRSVAFSLDGTLLASGSEDTSVRLWDVISQRCLNILNGHSDQVRSVAFSSDGTLLASGSEDNTIRIWEISSGHCLHILRGHSNRVKSVIFNVDGSLLISGSEDTTIRVWKVADGQLLRTLQGHTGLVYSVALHRDGETLASGSYDGTIKLWNIHSGTCLRTLEIEGPYQGMNITRVKGLTTHQKTTLRRLGAIEEKILSMH